MRGGAPHEDRVGEPGKDDVVEKAAPAGEEPGILDALDPRAGEAWWRSGWGPAQGAATRGSTSAASSSSCSIPQSSGFSTMCSQPPRFAALARIFSASSSASPSR